MLYLILICYCFSLHANNSYSKSSIHSSEGESFSVVNIEQDINQAESLPLTDRSYPHSNSLQSFSLGTHLYLDSTLSWTARRNTQVLGCKGPFKQELNFKKIKGSTTNNSSKKYNYKVNGGRAPSLVECLHSQWDHFFAENSPNAQFLQICLGEDIVHVRNALISYSKELRKKITVLAIAPVVYIEPNICRQVFYYIASAHKDFVPKLFPTTAISKDINNVFLSAQDLSFIDHDIKSPKYQNKLIERFYEFKQKGKRL